MRRDGADKMRAIAEEASAGAQIKGAYSGEHGDGLCRGEWISWQFGPAISGAFRDIKHAFDPNNLFNPGKMINPPKMDDASLFRFKPGTKPSQSTLRSTGAWNVQNDAVTEATTAPGTGGDDAQGFAKAVRNVQQQRPLPPSSTPAPCAQAIASRATNREHVAAPTRCEWQSPASSASTACERRGARGDGTLRELQRLQA